MKESDFLSQMCRAYIAEKESYEGMKNSTDENVRAKAILFLASSKARLEILKEYLMDEYIEELRPLIRSKEDDNSKELKTVIHVPKKGTFFESYCINMDFEVSARPMSYVEAIEMGYEEDPEKVPINDEDGYLVKYKDGQFEWFKKEDFEKDFFKK